MDTVWFGAKMFLGLILGAFLLWLLFVPAVYAGAAVVAVWAELTRSNKKIAVHPQVRDPVEAKRAGRCNDCGIMAENDVGELWHGLIREAGVCRKCQEYRLIRAAQAKPSE